MTLPLLRYRLDRAPAVLGARWLGFAALLALPLVVAGCSKEADKTSSSGAKMQSATSKSTGAVVAKINGIEIKEGDLALAEEDIGQQLASMPPESKRDYLITYVGDMILLTQAAEAKKLDQSEKFDQYMEFARKKLLMGKLLDTEGKAAVTDTALRKVYDDAVKQVKPEQEVHARHILVETEDEAKAVRAELQKGADFAQLAKQKSKDTSTAGEGGDVGYFTKEQMIPEFTEAAFKLEKGQLSDPVKSPIGWHIIKIEEKRTKPTPKFEEARPQIENYVMRKTQADYVTKLRESAKLERMDKPAAQAPAPPPAGVAAPDATAPPAKPAEPEKK